MIVGDRIRPAAVSGPGGMRRGIAMDPGQITGIAFRTAGTARYAEGAARLTRPPNPSTRNPQKADPAGGEIRRQWLAGERRPWLIHSKPTRALASKNFCSREPDAAP